jgi:hypothetical protein
MECTIRVLDPTAEVEVKGVKVNPPLHDLNGKMIGFLWDDKPNGDILLLRLKELLTQRFHPAGTNWWHAKAWVEKPQPKLIDEIAATSDTVLVALGD